VAVDSAGNTYISDTLSNRVFKVEGSGNLTVFVGNTVATYSGDNGSPTAATLNGPRGLFVDGSNNVFIADANNSAIRVVNTTGGSIVIAGVTVASGTIATIAGNGTSCLSTQSTTCGDGGAAVGPTLTAPSSVFVDSTGNIFIADTVDNRIREVSTSGTITTVAGTGSACSSPTATCGDGGLATSAQLFRPTSVYVDGSGNIYMADSGDNRVREVTASSGKISTIAGTGAACANPTASPACGDGGAATAAQLNLATAATALNPATYFGGITLDSGNLYIADSVDNRIRVVNLNGSSVNVQGVTIAPGNIATIAGTGNICTYSAPPQCGDGGAATSATLANPTGVLVLSGGNPLLIAGYNDDAVREVISGTMDPTGPAPLAGIIRDQSWSGDGPAPLDAELGQPPAIYSDGAGDIFIVGTFNASIRKLSAGGTALSTVLPSPGRALLCSAANCGDGGPISGVRLGYTSDIYVDASNNIFFADYEPSTGPYPGGLAVIRELPSGGTSVSTVAGKYGALGYSGDGGAATSALMGGPASTPTYARGLIKGLGLFLDKNGTIYIADVLNHAIRVVNPSTNPITIAAVTIQPGDIATVAGDGTACSSSVAACGDGGAATSAQLNNPSGVTVDGSGNIYIADSSDNRVREVIANTGVIQTFAGTGTACSGNSCGDFGPATSATLNFPVGVQLDSSGNLFIGDSKDAVVREVTASNGYIRTVAGNYTRGFSGDGGAATSAQLAEPQGVAFDPSGNLLIGDVQSWRVRRVTNVTLAATSTALASSANPSVAGQQVTFTATVTSKTSGTPTGTVTFYDGLTALGTPATVSSGAATLALSNLSTATHTITAVYSGDPTFDGSKSNAVSQAVTDFTVAAGALSPASVTAGGSATSTITLTSVNGFNAAVALTCAVASTQSEAPTCSFSSSSVTPTSAGATSTLTIATTGATAMLAPAAMKRQMFYAVWLVLPAMLLSTARLTAKNRRRLLGCLLVALAIGSCLFLASCSSGSTGIGGGGTQPGQYTVTITAAAGSLSHQTTVTLTVQ
jgi:sugar lactone lactonase YvrE